ncbi:MAG: O-antigen ligase family protein, partial [Oligoflexia bacterium]|nr:O-antigen ligase family protein [Oligoflexia bacterium]
MSLNKYIESFFFIALFFLSVGIFTSISITALHHIFLLITFILILYHLYHKRGQSFLAREFWQGLKHMPISTWALVGILGSGILSIIFNWKLIVAVGDNPGKHIMQLKYFFFALVSVIVYQEMGKRYSCLSQLEKDVWIKRFRWLWTLFLVATTVATLVGIFSLYYGYNPLRMKTACHPTRNCGLYGMYMTYAYGIQFFLLLLLATILNSPKGKRYGRWLIIIFIINLIGFVLSAARGALLGFALAIPFFFVGKGEWKKFIVVICLLLGLGAGVYWGSQTGNQQLGELLTSESRIKSQDIRYSQFLAVIEVFKQRPWLGIGFRNFEPYSSQIKQQANISYPEFGGHAHNNFLEHLASTGI